ncbi:MAG: BTAD domain-containing putative transcriptional regulator [Chloroflexota bacterium]
MLKISLLGSPKVEYNGSPITAFVSAKAEALLYYLAVTQQSHSRQMLTTLFWYDDDEAKGKASLRVALSNLNKLLPGVISASRVAVELTDDTQLTLDSEKFEKLLRRNDEISLESAAHLYRGPFFEDFQVDSSPAFETWMFEQRTHWQLEAEKLFQKLAAFQIQERRFDTAVSTLNQLLAIDPLNEEAHRQLMMTYSRQRAFNRALEQYEQCAKLLQDELDVEPMAETTLLQERILEARQLPLPMLPIPDTPFVGRDLEVTAVISQLVQPECRLITILGFGGMGKTRLGLAIAQSIAEEETLLFLNGVYFVSLQDATLEAGVDGIALAIAQSLDLYLPGKKQPADELISYLENLELLLLLDNFEQLIPHAVWLTKLLAKCPDVQLIVTSRQPLNIGSEWRFELDGLETNGREENSSPALELFLQSAQQIKPNFAFTEENRAHAKQICELVAGAPLAVRLAATWLRVMSSEQLVEEAKRSLDLLSTRLQDIPERQRSMRAIFETTWVKLSPQEQTTLASLAIFRGGFDDTAALQIASASPFLLADLNDRALVQFDTVEERYRLHELVRQFALEKNQNSSELLENHAQYFADLVETLTVQLKGATPKSAIQMFRVELENIYLSWQTAVSNQQVDLLLKIVDGLSAYTIERAEIHKMLPILELPLKSIPLTKKTAVLHIRLKGLIGFIYTKMWKMGIAELTFIELDKLAKEFNDPHGAGSAAIGFSRVFLEQGQYDRLLPYAQKAIDKGTEAEKPEIIIDGYFSLGIYHDTHEQTDDAIAAYEKGIALGTETNALLATFSSYINLAIVYIHQAQLDEAERYLEIVKTLSLQTGSAKEEGRYHYQSGRIAFMRGDYVTAKAHLNRGLAFYQRRQDDGYIARCERMLVRTMLPLGEINAARNLGLKALRTLQMKEHPSGMAITTGILGEVEESAGKWDRAIRYYEESIELDKQLKRPGSFVYNQSNLARTFIKMGKHDAAKATLLDGFHHALPINDHLRLIHLLSMSGLYLSSTEHPEHAKGVLEQVLTFPQSTAQVHERVNVVLSDLTAVSPTQLTQTTIESLSQYVIETYLN